MNNILVQAPFGFRMQHSTEQAVFSLINSIVTDMNYNQIVGGIFCNLQKAFDCVNHKIFVDKLQSYGIDGKFKILIESYITNRYQNVTLNKIDYNNNSSGWARINCGVPQGAILGPLFILIYINDLPTLINIDNNIILYAHDTSIVITDSNSDDSNLHANMLFNDTNTWFRNNLLNLNFSKTHYLQFRSMTHYKIHHNHNYISSTTQTKFLGLTVDDSLSWKLHTDQVIKRMSSGSYALRYIKYSVPTETKNNLLCSHSYDFELRYNLLDQLLICSRGILTSKENH